MERVDEGDLFEMELRRHRWDLLRQCSEEWRQDVPEILTVLRSAVNDKEASEAYFRLEGACFPQRLVTESCVAVVSCLLAALSLRPSDWVQGWAIEALRGIVGGEPIASELEIGNDSLMDDCRVAAKDGLWLLYGLLPVLVGPDRENLHLILRELDPDRSSGVA